MPEAQLRLLQQIPLHADPAGSRQAEERLYLDPVRPDEDEMGDEVNNDWRELVEPELRALFASQIDILTTDLKTAQRHQPGDFEDEFSAGEDDSSAMEGADSEFEEEDEYGLEERGPAPGEVYYHFVVPFDHVEAWYGALNQARLVMQERYQFPELETMDALMAMLQSENFQPYMISRFYVDIQGALLGMAMDREEE